MDRDRRDRDRSHPMLPPSNMKIDTNMAKQRVRGDQPLSAGASASFSRPRTRDKSLTVAQDRDQARSSEAPVITHTEI